MRYLIIALAVLVFASGCSTDCELKEIEDCCGTHNGCFFEGEELPEYEDEICEGEVCIKKDCLCSSDVPKAIACKKENNECKTIYESKTPVGECSSDSDCSTGGCSGQICGRKDDVKGIITTCEWNEQYGCLEKTSCGCVQGKCQWKKTDDYLICLDRLR